MELTPNKDIISYAIDSCSRDAKDKCAFRNNVKISDVFAKNVMDTKTNKMTTYEDKAKDYAKYFFEDPRLAHLVTIMQTDKYKNLKKLPVIVQSTAGARVKISQAVKQDNTYDDKKISDLIADALKAQLIAYKGTTTGNEFPLKSIMADAVVVVQVIAGRFEGIFGWVSAALHMTKFNPTGEEDIKKKTLINQKMRLFGIKVDDKGVVSEDVIKKMIYVEVGGESIQYFWERSSNVIANPYTETELLEGRYSIETNLEGVFTKSSKFYSRSTLGRAANAQMDILLAPIDKDSDAFWLDEGTVDAPLKPSVDRQYLRLKCFFENKDVYDK